MLSKTERDYLSGKRNISKSHARVLKYKIRNKLRDFYMLELPLIENAGVTEFNNIISEFTNGLVTITKKTISFERDSIPRPLPYQGNALPG